MALLPRLAAASKPRVITQQNQRALTNTGEGSAGRWREYLNRPVRFDESHAIGAEMTLEDNPVDHRAALQRGKVFELQIRQRDGNGIFWPDGIGKVAATRRQADSRLRYRRRIGSWYCQVYRGEEIGSSPAIAIEGEYDVGVEQGAKCSRLGYGMVVLVEPI